MKLIAFCLLTLSALGQEITNLDGTDPVRPVSKNVGLSINHCHPGDRAIIHVIPIPENDVRRGGWFSTTNDALKMDELSMLPSGLNRLEVRPVCRGLTGEVSHVVIDLQRPPPALKFGTVRVNKPAATNSPVPLRMAAKTAREWPPMPPMPSGMAGMMPLPDAETNRVSYKDSQLMKAYFSRQHRSQ